MARTARLWGPLGPIPPIPARCRSSVVEHSIGNGEVDSSILSGSTIFQCRINSYLDEGVGPISTARLRRLGKKAIADRCESIDRKRRDELLSDMMLSGLGELRDIPTKGRAKKRFFFVRIFLPTCMWLPRVKRRSSRRRLPIFSGLVPVDHLVWANQIAGCSGYLDRTSLVSK